MKIPRSKQNDYTVEMAKERRDFVEKITGQELEHVGQHSSSPRVYAGNIEHFMGVAQVPVGLAGPILVHGEQAQGDFYIPLATTEGTLVASYNRGMKLTREAGGITSHVIEDSMNRAPVFVWSDAGRSRDFGLWIEDNYDKIKELVEATTSKGKLISIQQFAASKIRWLRFNYTREYGD